MRRRIYIVCCLSFVLLFVSGHCSVLEAVQAHVVQDGAIHTQYGSREAVEQRLVRPVIEKAVYMTGPLMSSAESYAERRNELISFIDDQVENGVYQTFTEEVKQPDPITNEQKTVTVVKLKVDQARHYLRQDQSPLKQFGFVSSCIRSLLIRSTPLRQAE